MVNIKDIEVKKTFKWFDSYEGQLNQSTANFIRSLKKYYTKNKQLSDRQRTALMEIRNNFVESGA